MAPLTYNLKKLLKFTRKKSSAQVIAMEQPLNKFLLVAFCNAITLHIATIKFLLNPYCKKQLCCNSFNEVVLNHPSLIL
jgi:hypothetical protein